MNANLTRRSIGSRLFDSINVLFLAFYAIVATVPLIYVIAGSFASETEIATRAFFLIPSDFTTNAYSYIFSSPTVLRALGVSVFVTVVGTAINMLFTIPMAYSLSKRYIVGRNTLINLIIFSMLFGGGLIPTYLVVKGLGMIDKFWALWLPAAISPFNLIVIKNFFQEVPPELEESARMDGASDLQVLFRIVLPLSAAVIATFSLFYAVGHWNAYFGALIYINSPKRWPLQVILRNLVILSSGAVSDSTMLDPDFVKPPAASVKMAVIVVGTLPILLIYPFLQKHFVKGVLLGSVKG